MIYLNWNIERLETVLLDSKTIQKIAKMRAADNDIGESSIGGIVSVRVFQPDYEISISYSQSGNYDNYKETEALHIDFSRVNIFDSLDDISGPDENGGYYDEYNKEKMTWDDLVDLVVTNGTPSLFEGTENLIKGYLDELKENAVRCPVCGSTRIRKAGHKDLTEGVYQEYECNNRNAEQHPKGKPRKFRSNWEF